MAQFFKGKTIRLGKCRSHKSKETNADKSLKYCGQCYTIAPAAQLLRCKTCRSKKASQQAQEQASKERAAASLVEAEKLQHQIKVSALWLLCHCALAIMPLRSGYHATAL